MNCNRKHRDALEEADIVLSALGYDASSPIRMQIKEALNEPLRNCDVGNEKEQSVRYGNFCNNYHKMKGMCINCPLYLYKDDATAYGCYIRWSQMPYRKGKN